MSIPETNAYVKLRLLNGGSMIAPTKGIHKGIEENEFIRLYDWAFHIYEPESRRHVLWDVGMSNNSEDYIPSIRSVMQQMSCVGPRRSIVEQLLSQGVGADAIDTVLFSHAHFDHCRPIATDFPRAHGYFGPGTEDDCKLKMEPSCTDTTIGHKFDPRFFDPEVSKEHWSELRGPWVPFGPFDRAMDFFGNGSLWVIQAPGHMPGNLCAAARLEGGHWVLLASDCAHTRALLDGVYDIAELVQPDGRTWSLHEDVGESRQTIARLRQLEQQHGFHIALAHDSTWMLKTENDPVLFGLLDKEFLHEIETRIMKDEPF